MKKYFKVHLLSAITILFAAAFIIMKNVEVRDEDCLSNYRDYGWPWMFHTHELYDPDGGPLLDKYFWQYAVYDLLVGLAIIVFVGVFVEVISETYYRRKAKRL